MAAPEFVHLHVHSEYSLLDGANRISDLVRACVDDGQPAIALTDHGNLFGAVEMYRKARAAGIRPLLGCEVYVARQSRRLPHSKAKGNGYNHLTLIARNKEGWRNLVRLASAAYLEGYHFRPRIDKELLSRHARGLTCLSGCLAGELSQLAREGKEQDAERVAAELADLFGREHFWLELQRNGIAVQDRVNETLVRLSQRLDLPLVATNDVHYLRHEDCEAQDVLLCVNTGAKRADEDRFRFTTDTLYFKTREQMAETFRDLPEALKATMDVADQVDLELEFGNYHVPVFSSDGGESPDQLFDRLLEEGLQRRYGADNSRARERLEYEKRVIRELGFVSYFLIIWDLIRWARENGIPVGPGRGSAAGSIVAYLLDITRVDPLRYGLLFERFLNPSRVSMPDIDIDFCKEGRERVLAYTRQRYGDENVAQIVTFGTMASRTVVRDVGRVLDVPLKDVDRIAKKIPQGPGAPSLAVAIEKDPELAALREESDTNRMLFEFSLSLEGLARHISTHAAGVVIADRPIIEYVPLAKNGEDVTTQWPAPQLEELGLLKMDYLGLRTLTIIAKTLSHIERAGQSPPDLEQLPLDDPDTFALLMSGDTQGVFQLESEGMRKLIGRIRPDCFEDLIAILALYRPGPLESGMVDMFVRRKHGEEPITYPHESLEPILRDTYGCIVYQEQVMLISGELAGFSMAEADNLRKAMGKKKPEIMERFSEQFLSGAVERGCERAVAQEIWDYIVKFGGYGFNKSHSTAYALISYQTAYLKAHHRTAFLAANLSCEMQDSDKVRQLLDDARRAGVAILPPDISGSDWDFLPEGDGIRFGLGAIKGTGEKAMRALLAARDRLVAEGKALGLHALAAEVDPTEVGRLAWEALIQAGAFDFTGHPRAALMAALDGALADGARAARDRKTGQGDLFGGTPGDSTGEGSAGIDDGLRWDEQEQLQREYKVLGFYLSGHPLEQRAGLLSLLATTDAASAAALPGGSEVTMAGMILGMNENVVKSGRYQGAKMARFRLEDLTGDVGVTCFPRAYEEYKGKIEDGEVVVLHGRLEEGSEKPSVILESLYTIEEALAAFDGGVVVHLGPEHEGQIDALSSLLRDNPGNQRLYFQVRGSDGRSRRVVAGNDWRVSITSDLTRGIERLLGRGCVRLARLGG